jgi:hypothetical protein
LQSRCVGGNVPPPGRRPKKRPSAQGERPKSREETPKEGSGATIEDRNAALQKNAAAPHKKQGQKTSIAGCDRLSQAPAIFLCVIAA